MHDGFDILHRDYQLAYQKRADIKDEIDDIRDKIKVKHAEFVLLKPKIQEHLKGKKMKPEVVLEGIKPSYHWVVCHDGSDASTDAFK
jgi:hypothetical protein